MKTILGTFGLLLLLTGPLAAQQIVPVYAVCVGQYSNHCPACNVSAGPHMGCTGYDAVYDCSFADNPIVKVQTHFCASIGRFPRSIWRTQSVSGNKCGYSVIGVTCN
jgi:hypothetical protein